MYETIKFSFKSHFSDFHEILYVLWKYWQDPKTGLGQVSLTEFWEFILSHYFTSLLDSGNAYWVSILPVC